MFIVDGLKDRKGATAVRIAPTSNLYIAKASIDELIVPNSPMLTGDQLGNWSGQKAIEKFDMVISCSKSGVLCPVGGGGGGAIDLECRPGKLGSRDLRDKLGLVQ